MKKRIISAIALLILLAGCGKKTGDGADLHGENEELSTVQETPSESPAGSTDAEDRKIIKNAAWCVYWDADPADEPDKFAEYDELVLFGCIYSEDHSLYIPEKLDELSSVFSLKDRENDQELYISYVNDIMHPDGSSTQKSADFIREVLTDEKLSDRIIDDMIKHTLELGFDGLELDYENIHKCDGLWDEYLDFVSRLYSRADSEGLKLRVVLSVSTPADAMEFIEGPQYVVMCYNLYGNHSGPGPKADREFLKKTYDRFKHTDAAYALANGGFEWGADGKTIRSLTAEAAGALAEEKGAEVKRGESGELSYSFKAEDGMHTVCYGDGQTIDEWSGFLLEDADGDISVDLWRLE